MSNPAKPETRVSKSAMTRRGLARGALLVLAAALLFGGSAWLYARISTGFAVQDETLRRLNRDLNAVEVQADRFEAQQADLLDSVQHSASQISSFAARIDGHDQIVGELKDQLSGGRGRLQLVTVEQLLLLANDRLQLERDVAAAIVAIESADARLVALREPRLFGVRQALAQEKAALQAVPVPDYEGAALTLSSLIARAPRLPLATRVPSHFETAAARELVADDARWYERARAAIVEALRGIFTVRRDTGPSPQLLDVEQEALVAQVLALKLEGARIALLRGDTVSFRDLCESASTWLDFYFRDDDPGVASAKAELERLQPLDLTPPLPDISRSLALLREFLQPLPAAGGAPAARPPAAKRAPEVLPEMPPEPESEPAPGAADTP